MTKKEIEELEKLYKELSLGKDPPNNILMSWDQFRKFYGKNGEKLSENYNVSDCFGCALISKK